VDRKNRVSTRLARLALGADREGFKEAQALFRAAYDNRGPLVHGEGDTGARQWMDEHYNQIRAYVSFAFQRALGAIRLLSIPVQPLVEKPKTATWTTHHHENPTGGDSFLYSFTDWPAQKSLGQYYYQEF
jgi:hypothetical protein